jgi:cation diffusion facilitator family transporter
MMPSTSTGPFKPSWLYRNPKEKAAVTAVVFGFIDAILTTMTFISSNSSALLADTLKTVLELCAAIVSYIVLRRVSNSSSANFNYGTGKLESISSLFIGVLMCVCLLAITGNALFRIFHPSHISGAGVWAGMALQLAYLGVNGWIYKQNLELSKKENSTLLKSQANLFLSKLLANAFIFLSLLLGVIFASHEWAALIDPVASLIVGMFILSCATGVFSNSVFDLMDRTLEESDQLMILRGLARHFDSYEELHGIRSRRAGGKAFIEIHLEFAPAMKMAEVSVTAAAIKADIEKSIRNSQVSICLADKPI